MKKLGFGCMRLPLLEHAKGTEAEVDLQKLQRMIDQYLQAGFTYFDTAHGYHSGKSEMALRVCLVDRYPRDAYVLADKLTEEYFRTESEIRPFFENQLRWTGVSYFDYYLFHALTAVYYEKFTRCHAFDVVRQLKEEGKIRHIGMSFHDKAEVLDRILAEHPEIEVVQIQLNYIDYDDPVIQSGALLQVCKKHRRPVIVMEPCRGGALVRLPEEAKRILDPLGGTYAGCALRYAASFENVFMVLSGMSTEDQVLENTACMREWVPLSEKERSAVNQVREILKKDDRIGCTACRYCVDGCPQRISIPDLFACYHQKKRFSGWNSHFYYSVSTKGRGRASDCIGCGKCEAVCPQHLPVRKYLREVAAALEKRG